MWIKNASERGSKPQEKCLLVQQDEPGPSVLCGAAPQVHRSWAGASPQRVQTGILPPPGFEPLEFLQVTSTKPHSITPRATQTPEGSQDPQHSPAAPLLGSQTQGKRNPFLFSSSHTQINPASSAAASPDPVIPSSWFALDVFSPAPAHLDNDPRWPPQPQHPNSPQWVGRH